MPGIIPDCHLSAIMAILHPYVNSGVEHKSIDELSEIYAQVAGLREYIAGRAATLEELPHFTRPDIPLEDYDQRWFEGVLEAYDDTVRQEAQRLICRNIFDQKYCWRI